MLTVILNFLLLTDYSVIIHGGLASCIEINCIREYSFIRLEGRLSKEVLLSTTRNFLSPQRLGDLTGAFIRNKINLCLIIYLSYWFLCFGE